MSFALTRLSAATVASIGSPTSVRRILPSISIAVTSVRCFSDEGNKSLKFKKKKTSDSKSSGQRDKQLDVIIRALDARKRKEPPISEEERQRRHEIGRNHVIGRFERHNAIQHDLSCKLTMKKHAINMLPKNTTMREEALRVEDEPDEMFPPLERHVPQETPPHPARKIKYLGRTL